ncbi:ABC transporter ATP-binding protein [Brevibacillus sp. AY1]|uniref:ABC transporter ATP-binding protein n=1 Tax=Brevibacillus sp. AY1 TaxID=2807621 RepID=UPI002454B8D6|nr:ABC transporter ATP-binding protein [Brevibacillus sp. AY1]MDH4616615.1 ABC transporter ATP-binding protein [Brevibacillus sp. AY1]
MNQTPLTPMGVGKLLDRSFSIYRQRFGAFFLLALMVFGPLLLLQDLLLMDFSSMPFLYQDTSGEDFWESLGQRFISSEENVTQNIALLLVYLFIVFPIITLAAYPQLLASSLILTKAAVEGETTGIKAALRQSFSRFWPLVGSTVLYLLVIVGIFLAFFILCGLLFLLFAFSTGESMDTLFSDDSALNPIVVVVFFLVAYFLFIIGVMLVPGFFMLRWGFYLPLVLLKGEGVGLSKSWNLTKGNFWRLFGLYFVVMILYSIFSSGIQFILIGALGASLISSVLQVLFSCLLMPWMLIVYALAYLDLNVRKEGTDLEAMLNQHRPEDTAVATLDKQGEPHE